MLRAAGDVWPEEGRDGANATGAHRPRCDERGADRSAAGAIEVEGCSAESRKQKAESGKRQAASGERRTKNEERRANGKARKPGKRSPLSRDRPPRAG
ncbi:hypothetical protein FKO42_18250 [Burkholderia pseudomallei]|nr:hypothetical protein FKO42_18250 [Burkholderia pseudomallei]